MMDCVFVWCEARIEPVIEQLRPDDDELTTLRIPLHDLQMDGVARMNCPASLMGLPLSGPDRDQLSEQTATVLQMVNAEPLRVRLERERKRTEPQPETDSVPQTYRSLLGTEQEHGRTPHPQKNPSSWFRGGVGDGGTGGGRPVHIGPTARPKLEFLPGGGGTPERSAMGSVEEIKAQLAASNNLLGEAVYMAVLLNDKLAQALQVVNVVRESASQDIGAPQISEAIRQGEDMIARIQAAIDASAGYRRIL